MNPFAGLGRWVGVVVAAGALARCVRFFDGRSLWNDEAQLALNIWGREGLALLAPLDYAQSAPYGFLLLERLALHAFGPGELALRSVALIASLAALILFAPVARAALSRRAAQIAIVLFATSDPLIFYASEVKPYSLDVAVAVAWLALLQTVAAAPLDRRSWSALAIAGALAPWFSFPALFGLAAAGLWLAAGALRRDRREPHGFGPIALLAGIWAVSCGLLYWLQIGPAMGESYLREFWDGAFAPWLPRTAADWAWYPRTLAGFFADPLGLPPWWLALAMAGVGVWRLGSVRPVWLWWLLGPLAIGLLASMFELYPLRTQSAVDLRSRIYPLLGRLWLFAVPAGLLLVAEGVATLAARAGAWRNFAAIVLTLAVAGLSLRQFALNTWDPPAVQEFRPVAIALRERVGPGDRIWVQRGGEPTFEYYARLLGLRVRAQNVGATEPEDVESLERAVEALAPGDRVWLVSLQHPAWETQAEHAAIVARLVGRAHPGLRLEAPGAAAVEYRVPPQD